MIQASKEVAIDAAERIDQYRLELADCLANGDELGALRQVTRIRGLADVIGSECIKRMLQTDAPAAEAQR